MDVRCDKLAMVKLRWQHLYVDVFSSTCTKHINITCATAWQSIIPSVLPGNTCTLSSNKHYASKQGVALTGHNRTGPPCSVGRLTAHMPGLAAANRPRAQRPASPPAGSVTDDRQRQTPASKQYWPIRRTSNNKNTYTWQMAVCQWTVLQKAELAHTPTMVDKILRETWKKTTENCWIP